MSEITIQALVLQSKDYLESDKLLTLYSLEQGKLTAQLRGVKKPKAKLSFAGQPFCFAEFTLVRRGEWFLVTGAQAIDLFYDIQSDSDRYFAGCVLLEMVKRFATEQGERSLFIAALEGLSMLSYGKGEPCILCGRVMLSVLQTQGYALRTDVCAVCGTKLEPVSVKLSEGACAPVLQSNDEVYGAFFSLDNHGFSCAQCHTGKKVRGETMALLSILVDGSRETIENVIYERDIEIGVLRLLRTYYEYLVDEKLNSITYLLT